MDQQQWQKVEEIVDTALTMDEPERKKYIQQECKGDKKLKNSVTELLQSIEESADTNYLEDPVQHREFRNDFAETNRATTGESLVGQQIGVYKITELIGHGGMGSVYAAKRSDKLHDQQLAMKILPRGMDSPSNIARFRREQQILAKLDHPNIARLIDGGVTEDGRPYLVMEYVNGTPLYKYCDEHQLSVEERLQLLTSLCQAVQHAHNNAIIHRDLKPSNILVTDDGNTKVLDFGISKLLEPEDPSTTIFQTRTGARMFTLGYAAPEQIKGNTITTAADAYGLGVLFYELLGGVHPFELEDKSLTEIEQQIRKQTPATVCSKFQQLPEEKQQQLAKRRNTMPPALLKSLSGDLEAIIMKALRKEPEARYNSAEQLLNDLQRHQQNLPVVAREDTWRYKTSKFFKRYKTGLSVVMGFLMLVIGFAGFYTWQIAQERNKAQQESQKAKAVTNFLTELIESNYPENARGDTITVRNFLDQAFSNVQKLEKNPLVQAEIMKTMGHTYRNLGENEKAKTLINNTLNLLKAGNASAEELASSYNVAGLIYRDLGKPSTALEYFKKSIDLFQKAGQTQTKEYAKILRDLAYMQAQFENFSSAETNIKNSIDILLNINEAESVQISESYYVFASILRRQEQYPEALKYQQKSYTILQQKIKGPHPGKAANLSNLALLYESVDSTAKVMQTYQKSIKMTKKLYGVEHPEFLIMIGNLSRFFVDNDMLDSALVYSDSVMQVAQKIYNPKHERMSSYVSARARIFNKSGKFGKADSLYQRAINIAKIHFKPTHNQRVTLLNQWGRNAYMAENYKKALKILEKAFKNSHDAAKFNKSLQHTILKNLLNTHKKLKNTAAIDSLTTLLSSRNN